MQKHAEAVQRMQAHIAEHLFEKITLADLARASRFSPWYAHRLFSQRVGRTPADYIRRLRLSKSALRLRDEPGKIADIAFEMGFESVDGYQRAFARAFGCNPRTYAMSPVPLYLFTPYPVPSTVERSVSTVYIQLIEKPARKALIKRGVNATEYFAYCEEVGCDVWGLLTSMKSLDGEPAGLWLPPAHIRPSTSAYVQGVEVPADYDGAVPEDFDALALPAAKYLMFKGEPFTEEAYAQAITEVQAAIANYDPAVVGLAWDNANPRMQLEPIGTRGYIELVPVKSPTE
ncbi:MAG: helix-turn-helix transcriptional regulator [Clostridiales bacterium]|nr:helix-turn-helix transcriptional regulator [Clostridiales bacterium]